MIASNLTPVQGAIVGQLYGYIAGMADLAYSWKRDNLFRMLRSIEDEFGVTPHPMYGTPPPWRREGGEL